MTKKLYILSLFSFLLLLNFVCFSNDIISPDLNFNLIIKESEYDPNYVFGSMGASMAVDNEGFIYLLDAQGGFIRKYDINGKYILKFGRSGDGPGEIQFLSYFSNCLDGNLFSYSINTKVINVFSKTGSLVKSYRKKDRLFNPVLLKNGSILYADNKWVENGKNYNSYFMRMLILDDNKKLQIIKSYTDGKYRKALSKVSTRAFQDNWTYCEDFVYAADSRNNIYYAITDTYQIWRYRAGKSELLIKDNLRPVPFNNKRMIAEIKKEEEMRAKVSKAKYFLTIPEYWQLIYKLTVDDKDNIWVYVKSRERHGLVKYLLDGIFQKYYKVDLFSKNVKIPRSDFQLFVWKNNVYVYRYNQENGVEVYLAKIGLKK